MGLRWELHTLDGIPRAGLGPDRDSGKVTINFNGERTAEVRLSIYDEACQEVVCGKRLLKCWWDDLGNVPPVFAGVLMLPDWQGEQGYVTLSAVDPKYRLDRAPLLLNPVRRAVTYWRERGMVTGEVIAAPSYESLDDLIEAARPAAYGFDDPTIPDVGVAPYIYGPDEPKRKPMPILEITRGESVWALMTRCSQSVFGPDFDLAPIDQVPGTWDYTRLGIYQRLGRELQDDPSIVFHYRFGQNNVVDATYRPGGDQLTNAFYSAYTVGGDTDTENVVNYYDPASIAEYGLMGSYESAGCQGSAGKGIATVAAYREPPGFFTFQPAIEGFSYAGREDDRFGVPPMALRDYGPGDTVRCIAQRGYFQHEMVGRVTVLELAEKDRSGAVQVSVTTTPRVGIDGIAASLEET